MVQTNSNRQSSLIAATDVGANAYSRLIATEVSSTARLIFVSGQVARDDEGRVVGEGDFETQCLYVFNRLSDLLVRAGSSMSDLVKVTIFLRDFSNYQKLVEIRRQFYSAEHPPASSAVAVNSLIDSRFLIEVEGIAITSTARPR